MNSGDEPGEHRRPYRLSQCGDVHGRGAEVPEGVVHPGVSDQHGSRRHGREHRPIASRESYQRGAAGEGEQRECRGGHGVHAGRVAPDPDRLANAPPDHVVARAGDGAEQGEDVTAKRAEREPRVAQTDEARPDHGEHDAPGFRTRRVLAQPYGRETPGENGLERHEDDRAGDRSETE